MAKLLDCGFCGKEITKKLINSEAYKIGYGVFKITCCEDCYKKFEPYKKYNEDRFIAKLENYQFSTKTKIDKQDIPRIYEKYIEEQKLHLAKTSDISPLFEDINENIIFNISSDGKYFSVCEFEISPHSEDMSVSAMENSKYKSIEFSKTPLWFSKDDITKIEYCMLSSATKHLGELGYEYVSFAIRFNDETTITNKPCITRVSIIGHGLIFKSPKKEAEKILIQELNGLKSSINSDLPIVKMKKKEFRKSVMK